MKKMLTKMYELFNKWNIINYIHLYKICHIYINIFVIVVQEIVYIIYNCNCISIFKKF